MTLLLRKNSAWLCGFALLPSLHFGGEGAYLQALCMRHQRERTSDDLLCIVLTGMWTMHQRAKECTKHDPHSVLRRWGWAVFSTWPEGLGADLSTFLSDWFSCFPFAYHLWHIILEKASISTSNVFFRKYIKRQQDAFRVCLMDKRVQNGVYS